MTLVAYVTWSDMDAGSVCFQPRYMETHIVEMDCGLPLSTGDEVTEKLLSLGVDGKQSCPNHSAREKDLVNVQDQGMELTVGH